jgi:XTP/dITP diphosphohydrolase
MKLVLATRNPGKVAELRARLIDLPVALVAADEVAGAPEVEETAETLRGNAALKAEALHAHTGLAALADDTGLEVDALGGAPGVHSARYAGPEADPAANRRKLLAELDGEPDRRARFRTVLAYADGTGVHYFDGVCEGTITAAEYGEGGFGYDALFRPDEQPTDTNPGQPEGARTFAEMTTEEKNRLSHRGRALDAFAAWLAARLDTPA